MDSPRLAWVITGSGHYIEECLDFLLTLQRVDLYLSQAGEEVLKMYGVDLNEVKQKLPVYRDKAKSAPPVGLFYKGYYQALVMAPTTSNTMAKCALGIADSLATNLYSQAGKCKVPSIVYPCDTAPEILTTAPGGKKFWVYPRPIDLDATDKLKQFPFTEVVEDVEQLIQTVTRLLQTA